MAIKAHGTKARKMGILVTTHTFMALTRQHGLAVGSVAGLAWLLVMCAFKAMGTKIMYLLQIGLPAFDGVTTITAAAFTTIVDIGMAAIAIDG